MATDNFLVKMGQRIAQRRKELRFTQEQLAEKMGVSLQTISCIELGKKAIRPENLTNLCLHLEITADYILCGKRTEAQMGETIAKLSELTAEEFSHLAGICQKQDGPVNETAFRDCVKIILGQQARQNVSSDDALLALQKKLKESKGTKG